MGVKLRSSIATALASSKREQLGSITFLGKGGPYHIDGGISFFIDLDGHGVLVNCGPCVTRNARLAKIAHRIHDVILLTSQESEIGSLISLVEFCHETAKRRLNIICPSIFERDITSHLFHNSVSDKASLNDGPLEVYFDLTNDGESSMILHSSIKNEPLHILLSGYAKTSMIKSIADIDAEKAMSLERAKDSVVIIHSASEKEEGPYCHSDVLSADSEMFRNFFLFGHSKEEGARIVFNERYMRSLVENDTTEFIIERK